MRHVVAFFLAICSACLILETQGDVICGKGMLCKTSFTYTVNNNLFWPSFTHTTVLKIKGKKPFLWYMEKACKNDPDNFKTFTTTYYQQYGYYVEGVNGLLGNWKDNRTYWEFSNATFGSLDTGVSYYVPSPGDQVLLNFTVSPTPSKVYFNGRRP